MPIKILDDPQLDGTSIYRFWKRVKRKDNDCWHWIGSQKVNEYGKFVVKYKQYQAHRIMWILKFGAIPKSLQVLHRCDTPSCVNPDHLFLGTQADNITDMVKKGRNTRALQRGKQLNKHVEIEIIQKYHKHINTILAQLALDYDTSIHVIRDIIYTVTPKLPTTDITPTLQYQIKNDYEMKKGSMRTLATKYSTNVSTVHAIIHNKYGDKHDP